jgi:hypothetical protein
MGNKYEATGLIHTISAAETRGTFTFRKFVVEMTDNPKYPQFVEFQATRDEITALDKINVGDEVRISFDIRGREWKSPQGEVKTFNTLQAWKIESTNTAARASGAAPPPPQSVAPPAVADEDIPFASCDLAHELSPIARVLR